MTVLTWPVRRLRDVRRTYDVALSPSDTMALVREAIKTDPMHLPWWEGATASHSWEAVGRVHDDGRVEIYISHRGASGLGLVGRVKASGKGSRIVTRVGWTGLHRWGHPVFTALVIALAVGLVFMAAGEEHANEAGACIALALVLLGGWTAHLASAGRQARRHELPVIFECLERVLAPPDVRQPPLHG